MNIKMMLVALFVVVAMSSGLFASVPVVEAFLPWVGAFAVVSAFWPIVALVLGAFGVMLFSKKGDVSIEFDLEKPGHRIGWLVNKAAIRSAKAMRSMASKVGEAARNATTSSTKGKKKIVVQPVFKNED